MNKEEDDFFSDDSSEGEALNTYLLSFDG